MHISRVEPNGDPTAGTIQRDRSLLNGPVTGKGPMVHAELARIRIDSRLIRRGSADGRKVVRSPVAKVRLGSFQIIPVRGRLETAAIDGHQCAGDLARPGFGEQLLNHALALGVPAFTELVMSLA